MTNPLTANHNNCHLLCHLLGILKVIFADSVCSLIRVHTVCLYAKIGLKSLQEHSADDINRRFSDAGFLGILRVYTLYTELTLKVPIKTTGDDILKYSFIFQIKMS